MIQKVIFRNDQDQILVERFMPSRDPQHIHEVPTEATQMEVIRYDDQRRPVQVQRIFICTREDLAEICRNIGLMELTSQVDLLVREGKKVLPLRKIAG